MNAHGSPHHSIKIAIASSGLGHIQRGVETWALTTATALYKRGYETTLFQGAGTPAEPWRTTLNCSTRFDPNTLAWVDRFRRLGGWRFGFGSGYEMEQVTFAYHLWRATYRTYDIVHVQDPIVALILDRLWKMKLSRPRVILAHGTDEPVDKLQKYSVLQHLAPNYLEDWLPNKPRKQQAFAVPNFVDTDQFTPADKIKARQEWDLSPDQIVILAVSAIKRHHKRIDVLLEGFRQFDLMTSSNVLLIVAGGTEADTNSLIAIGRDMLGGRVLFMTCIDRTRMPSLFRTADVFIIPSLHEMMPIALLEAMASGLPIICNDTPTMRWMVGKGGSPSDITSASSIAAEFLRMMDSSTRKTHGEAARDRAVAVFSEDVVIDQIITMYDCVTSTS